MPILSEADVSGQIKDYLVAKGWRSIRNQRTVVPGQFQTCEPGMADFLFLYYLKATGRFIPATLALWIEVKKPKARPRCKCIENSGTRKRCTFCDQRTWREREKARGGVVWSGVDDFEWFEATYESTFGWLHNGDAARGQLELLVGMEATS
jgi:hypothetical protein